MYLTLLAFTALLPSQTGTTQTCNTLNHFIDPTSVLVPDYPKSDVCRNRETPHCCTRSVEAVMIGSANADAKALFFSHLMRMRTLTANQYISLQSLKLPYMSDALQQTALEFKLLNNLSTSRETLITQATVDFINIYYNVEYVPNFCKQSIVESMKDSLNIFLQELVFSHDLVETNWNVAEDLFAVVFSSQFSSQCVNELLRSGLTQISCKTCTDQTIKIPTCFDYCTDVVAYCLEPYQPIIELINEWFNLYVRVQARIHEFIHLDRFLKLKAELTVLVEKELEDEFFADVCEYHFKESPMSDKDSEYNIPNSNTQGRRKRMAKTSPHTNVFSTRYISFGPTSETPSLPRPAAAGNELFDPNMLCLNATQSVTTWECWNGDGSGEYTSWIPATGATPTNTFDDHVPRLKSKMNDLVVSLTRELVIQKIETNSNEVEPLETKTSSLGQRPNFKTVTILLIVMTWIKLII